MEKHKSIRKVIKVITDQNIVRGQKQNGFPMRKWKISICGVSANGDEETMPYVDHVEYILHQTFEPPVRKVNDYPFLLQEQGWGEFDMKIMLHFVDKSVPPFVLDHDLNFQSNHYEVPQTITFKSDLKASFVKLLNLSATNASDRESSNDSAGDSATQKRRRDVIAKEKVKRMKGDRSSDDESQADSSVVASGDEWGDKIDVHLLAKKFQLLQPEDLVELVQIVKANQTPDMYVREDGEAGEFHIDLRTLGNDLLAELWQFCERKLEQ
ncbi:hypothetical protein BGZ65_007752 [Modicella reniformis]|uniref:YEATS domain-containing protein n=1 Tax=Modicella reniformis TaxID=1440133 RepID=A0A9P6JH01_9FUNG|nr:hypothetical protein BGZ65_007752 [Modicella reniformis]